MVATTSRGHKVAILVSHMVHLLVIIPHDGGKSPNVDFAAAERRNLANVAKKWNNF